MSKLVIGTQYKENYNTTGEGEPYWKFKGGSEYIVSIPKGMSEQECLEEVTPLIEYKNEMSEEFVLGHFVTGNSYQSDFEKSQLALFSRTLAVFFVYRHLGLAGCNII